MIDPDRRRVLRREFLLAQLNEHRARRAMLRDATPERFVRWEDMHAVLTAAAHEFYRYMSRAGAW